MTHETLMSKIVKIFQGPTDGPTDRRTDRPTDMTTPRSSSPELKNNQSSGSPKGLETFQSKTSLTIAV